MVEKLIEEISGRIQFVADIGMQSFQAASAVQWAFEKERRGLALAEELITRIGKAYVDGLPLPDEVGRGTLHWKHGTFTLEVSDALTLEVYGTFRGDKGNLPFIALRKEGMDKKEE